MLEQGLAVLEGMLAYRSRNASAIPDLIKRATDGNHGEDNAGVLLEQHGFEGEDPRRTL